MPEMPEIHDGDQIRIIYEGIATNFNGRHGIHLKTQHAFDKPYMPLEYAKSVEVLSHGDPERDAIGTIRGGQFIKLTEWSEITPINGASWWNLRDKRWAPLNHVRLVPITQVVNIKE